MAAPPRFNAAQMRQVQLEKLPAYNARLDEIAAPLRDLLLTRLEQAMQAAIEDPRPQTLASASIKVDSVEAVDRTLVINRLRAAVTERFGPGRGFNPMFSVLLDPPSVTVGLTW